MARSNFRVRQRQRRGAVKSSAALLLQLLLLSLCLGTAPVFALNIVLTNDDGFETANIQALYRALVQAGHDVILSAPYVGQSGSGGRLEILRPLGPTSEPSEEGLLPAGSPPLGPTTLAPQQYYVDSTPAVAVAYGIDVLAPKLWEQGPDLVISGPNEGNNLGIITPHSGTLGAAVFAINKQIPAIAVSAAGREAAAAAIVAELVIKLVAAISTDEGVALPAGTGLNVNLPKINAEATSAADFSFVFTRLGTSADFGLQFFEDLGSSPVARAFGVPADIKLPGLAVATSPTEAGYPEDAAGDSEANRLAALTVTVSPIRGTYAANDKQTRQIRRRLKKLFVPRSRDAQSRDRGASAD